MSTEKRKEKTDPEDPKLEPWFQRQEEVDKKMRELGWEIPEKEETSEGEGKNSDEDK